MASLAVLRRLRGNELRITAGLLVIGAAFYTGRASGFRAAQRPTSLLGTDWEALSARAKTPAVQLQIYAATRGQPLLEPGKPGLCYFHGQQPHKQDRGIFERLGGSISHSECHALPLAGTGFPSESEVCPCVAPSDPNAFGQGFLEIGALDGTFLSNLLFFESQLGWRGLCVEASPVNFALLEKNRPQCNTVNALISPKAAGEEGKRTATFFSFTGEWLNSMSCMEGHSVCKDRAAAQEYARENRVKLQEHQVPMRTLASLFAEHKMKRLGWLMVDVEGAEGIVFRTIDWSAVCARFVTYEGDHPSVETILDDAGYSRAGSFGPDSIYKPGPGVCDAGSKAGF